MSWIDVLKAGVGVKDSVLVSALDYLQRWGRSGEWVEGRQLYDMMRGAIEGLVDEEAYHTGKKWITSGTATRLSSGYPIKIAMKMVKNIGVPPENLIKVDRHPETGKGLGKMTYLFKIPELWEWKKDDVV
jgi:hypothetical protein